MKQQEDMSEEELEEERRVQKDLDLARAYKAVFNSVDGRKVLKSMMRDCHFFTPNKTMHDGAVQYTEGRRSVIMDILGALDKDEEQLMKIFMNRNNEIDEEENL